MSERWPGSFGLARDPFTKEIPTKDAYETRDLKEVRARLDFLSRAGGVGLVTAKPGFGKTFAPEPGRTAPRATSTCATRASRR